MEYRAAWAVLLALLLDVCFVCFAAAAPGSITGKARVVDGDTLEVYAQVPGETTTCTLNAVKVACAKIRIYGIDAPESAQKCQDAAGLEYACGQVSKQKLAELVGAQQVTCAWNTTDYYGRHPATCSVGSVDVSAWLAEAGMAIAYRDANGALQYGGKYYLGAEDKARAAHLGVWQGAFTLPALWRKQQDGSYTPSNASATPPNPECPIKGNIGTEKIYHVPSNSTYASTIIDTAQGEQWFCSEEEALAAGWRPSGRAIKGNIGSTTGEKIYHTPGSRYYSVTKIDTTKGERWFATEREALAAGWRKAA